MGIDCSTNVDKSTVDVSICVDMSLRKISNSNEGHYTLQKSIDRYDAGTSITDVHRID